MKKSLLFLLMLSLAFLSCETSDINQQEELTIDLAKIENVNRLFGDEQKVAFRLLNNENKAFLWKEHIDIVLKNNNLTLNQRESIIELRKYIQGDLYNLKSKKGKLIDFKLTSWIEKNRKYFTRKEAINYFVSLNSNFNKGGEVVITIGEDNCECNVRDDWCITMYECDKGGCEEQVGCGFFWSRDCNGTCEVA